MSYEIVGPCKGCGICALNCPEQAIRRREKRYVINAQRCLGCGVCAAICPLGTPRPRLEKGD